MSHELIVPGRYVDHTFIADGPLPDGEGKAELRISTTEKTLSASIFDLFGKASQLRTATDIAVQIAEDRQDWGEP